MSLFRLSLLYLCGAVLHASCSIVPVNFPSPSINIFTDNRDSLERSVQARLPVHFAPSEPPRDLSASNSTLGFEAIIAISSEDDKDPKSWRKKGLLRAARRANLDVTVPKQRDFTYKEVVARRDAHPVPITDGEALCYVAHMDALRTVVDRGYGSALILEDDADWDVHLRRQIGPVAAAVRLLTGARPARRGGTPYGDNFDLLFLGHCGDTLQLAQPRGLPSVLVANDPWRLPAHLLRSVYSTDAPYAPLGEGARAVQWSQDPVCTFGYGVTARGARKVLDLVSGPGREIDLMLKEACGNGALDCVSVMPELIHHGHKVGSRALSTENGKVAEDRSTLGRVFTHNILYSARCNWNRWGWNMMHCLPTLEEWWRYST